MCMWRGEQLARAFDLQQPDYRIGTVGGGSTLISSSGHRAWYFEVLPSPPFLLRDSEEGGHVPRAGRAGLEVSLVSGGEQRWPWANLQSHSGCISMSLHHSLAPSPSQANDRCICIYFFLLLITKGSSTEPSSTHIICYAIDSLLIHQNWPEPIPSVPWC